MEVIFMKILEIQRKYYYDNYTRKRGWKGKLRDDYKKNKKDFVTRSALSKFDFTNDCFNEIYMNENCSVYKYLLYRVSQYRGTILYQKAEDFRKCNAKKYRTVIDPGSESLLLQVLYEDLYDVEKFRDRSLFIKDDNDKVNLDKKDENADIVGDMMNTVQSVLNSYVEKHLERCLEQEENDNVKEIRKKNRKEYYPVSFAYFLELYCRYGNKICEKLEKVNAQRLMETYHTLGNFIVIPIGCNVPRGKCILKDFWDLTLACIYNWYSKQENREDRIVKVIDNKCLEYSIGMIFTEESSLKKYIEWLSLFGTWDKFVEDNYLGDSDKENFVKKINNEHYGRPKELWPGHFTGGVMPTNIEEYKMFFTNSSEYIQNRGLLMQEKLQEKMKNANSL